MPSESNNERTPSMNIYEPLLMLLSFPMPISIINLKLIGSFPGALPATTGLIIGLGLVISTPKQYWTLGLLAVELTVATIIYDFHGESNTVRS
jgi:hypothetical protein